jgi:hypothetical protein
MLAEIPTPQKRQQVRTLLTSPQPGHASLLDELRQA